MIGACLAGRCQLRLMKMANDGGDYIAQFSLRWLVNKQLEEVSTTDELLSTIIRGVLTV